MYVRSSIPHWVLFPLDNLSFPQANYFKLIQKGLGLRLGLWCLMPLHNISINPTTIQSPLRQPQTIKGRQIDLRLHQFLFCSGVMYFPDLPTNTFLLYLETWASVPYGHILPYIFFGIIKC